LEPLRDKDNFPNPSNGVRGIHRTFLPRDGDHALSVGVERLTALVFHSSMEDERDWHAAGVKESLFQVAQEDSSKAPANSAGEWMLDICTCVQSTGRRISQKSPGTIKHPLHSHGSWTNIHQIGASNSPTQNPQQM